MRVFENSLHGGLGRGKVGVVAAGAGVGKTPLLVQIALDHLLHDRRVLHISHEHAVDHVRSFYSEVFHDLATVSKLSDPEAVKLDLERHRLIFSLMARSASSPLSERGGRSSVARIQEVVTFAREIAHFQPDVVIIDGVDLAGAASEAVSALGALARDLSAELWLAVRAEVSGLSEGALPAPIDTLGSLVHVVVGLEPERDVTQLRLLKDHDNTELSQLRLRLDPYTMRVIDEDVRPLSERPRDPRRFRLLSGGSKGAEAAFGECAERWGMTEVNYSYEGHPYLERTRGVVVLGEDELRKGDFSLLYASRRLNRVLTKIPFIRSVLQTTWHQVTNAHQVFVIGEIQEDNTVRGGTGWGAELARLWKKPVYVYDQTKRAWFRWSGTAWEIAQQPTITSESFAGIGTLKLNEEGKAAVCELFRRSFGDCASN
jgi:hypothetical protein